MKRRLFAAIAASALCLLPLCASAYSFLSVRPGSRLSMNADLDASVQEFFDGVSSLRDVFGVSMATWNTIGIGPGLDHKFFSARSPVVVGDACDYDLVNEVRFAQDRCGMAFGTALAVTISRSQGGITQEADMLFSGTRSWNVYGGPLLSSNFDFRRVAIHELGHAAGLDHPDENGQTVSAIMNSHVSDIDSPTADDIAGAHAISWNATGASTATLSVIPNGLGIGTITSSPSRINCGTTCSATFPINSSVTLVATPAAGSTFFGWTGDCSPAGVVQMTSNKTCTARFDLGDGGPAMRVSTTGTRATVTPGAIVYGAFSMHTSRLPVVFAQKVYIVVRGPSLQTLGITQNALDLPGLRLFDSHGADVLKNSNGGSGVSTCPATSTVATYYRTVRGQTLSPNDACVAVDLVNGIYTFTIEPTSSDTSGEVLFEVLYNPELSPGASSGVPLSTIGSRGTVAGGRTMFGGFTLEQQNNVMIAVRGPSLQTLGITQSALDSPGLRLYDATGTDLLQNVNGGTTVAGCNPANSTAAYYANVRSLPLDQRDTCIAQRTLPAGVYTFTIDPVQAGLAGEVLFEVTFSQ